jgi:hypothetical protein
LKQSASYNLKAARNNIVSLLATLHQLLLLIPERSENQKKNRKNRKGHGKFAAGEKVVDGLHDENELIDFGL